MIRAFPPCNPGLQLPHVPPPVSGVARALLLLAITVLAGCRTIEGTRGVPPFYEVYYTPSSIDSRTGDEVFFRPLGSFERSDGDAHRLRLLFPFLDFEWGPEKDRYWALPAFLYRRLAQPFGRDDVDWMVFPIIYGGSDPDEGSYFAVFPLGGTLKGYLLKDEISFILFPFYVKSRDRDRRSLHVLWPFYNEVWGGDWSGWRLWPFYGRYRSVSESGQLRAGRSFIAWPFYIHKWDDVDLMPSELTLYFPFYGERRNRRSLNRTYLWPLLQVHHDKRYDRTEYAGYIFPFRFTEGQADVWPFFGTKKVSRSRDVGGILYRRYRHFVLWPIERYEWSGDGLEESVRFWLLPLLWHYYYIDRDALRTRVETKVWPLFRYRRDGDNVSLDVVSPLWFHREDYDRHYSRWFAVFRHRWKDGLGGWELLYGAVMYRRDDPGREKLFSVLGGLFETGKKGGDFALKLLWIPLW